MQEILNLPLSEMYRWLRARNQEYRLGEPTVTDEEYDLVYEEYSSRTNNRVFDGEVSHKRVHNSIPMYGLEKIKSFEDLSRWISSNHLSEEIVIITPKYDGVSCGVQIDGGKVVALVKGKDNMSHSISHHFSLIEEDFQSDSAIVGEIIIPQAVFSDLYSGEYKNPRNMVAGKLNPRSKPSEELYDFVFMKYTSYGTSHTTKEEMLLHLNEKNKYKVPYIKCPASEITEEMLYEAYSSFIKDFEIDGLVIDINDLSLAEKLGRNSIGNPNFAVAYKGKFGDIRDVSIKSIKWTIDKDGVFNPTISTDLVQIDGALCGKNIYVDNARYVRDHGLFVGKKIKIKRGGKIIPRIYEPVGYKPTTDYKSYNDLVESGVVPWNCPYCHSLLEINDDLVDISCPNHECIGRNFQSIVFFFKTISVIGLSNASISLIVPSSIEDHTKVIIDMIKHRDSVFSPLGKKMSKNVLSSLEESLSIITLDKLMHAFNIFPSMGSGKIGLILNHFGITFSNILDFFPGVEDVMQVHGIGDVQSKIFVERLHIFKKCYSSLLSFMSFEEKSKDAVDGELSGRVFCFTGFRHAGIEAEISARGGEVSSSYTKKVTDLVMKQKGSGSSKEKKAIADGVNILSESECRELLQMKTIIEEEQEKLVNKDISLF